MSKVNARCESKHSAEPKLMDMWLCNEFVEPALAAAHRANDIARNDGSQLERSTLLLYQGSLGKVFENAAAWAQTTLNKYQMFSSNVDSSTKIAHIEHSQKGSSHRNTKREPWTHSKLWQRQHGKTYIGQVRDLIGVIPNKLIAALTKAWVRLLPLLQ